MADRSGGEIPRLAPERGEPAPPGKPMSVEQQLLDKGAAMLQLLKPVKQFCQHACTFALYGHDLTRQIETHHFVTRIDEDFLQCAVYDTDDSHGRLIGVEYIISDHIFETLTPEEQKLWHSHAYEIKSGLWVNPRVPEMVIKPELENLVKTYGKFWCTWQADRASRLICNSLPSICMTALPKRKRPESSKSGVVVGAGASQIDDGSCWEQGLRLQPCSYHRAEKQRSNSDLSHLTTPLPPPTRPLRGQLYRSEVSRYKSDGNEQLLFGKTIDEGDRLPMGPPALMFSPQPGVVRPDLVHGRDHKYNVDSSSLKASRVEIPEPEWINPQADYWKSHGNGFSIVVEPTEMKKIAPFP